MVIGCFTNFAQNEYGLKMYYHCCFLVGITLLIDAFISLSQNFKTNKLLAIYLFAESFLLGIMFIAFEAKNLHWNYTGPVLLLSIASILLLYFLLAFRVLFKELKYGKAITIGIFFIIINTLCAIGFYVFKTMHWPGTIIVLSTSATLTALQILFFIIRRKYYYKGEKINIINRMRLLPGKLPMAYCYFTIFVVHFCLFIWGIAPNFYVLRIPPAMQKMNDDNNPKAQVFGQNMDTFIDNRQNAEESK